MMRDGPITSEEMVEMFGERMPVEAARLLWDSPGEKTIGEIRAELRKIAEARPPTMDRYETWVSDEPLEVIRANECEADIGSLCTKRFRRLWNEIVDLRALSALTPQVGLDREKVAELARLADYVERNHYYPPLDSNKVASTVAGLRAIIAMFGDP